LSLKGLVESIFFTSYPTDLFLGGTRLPALAPTTAIHLSSEDDAWDFRVHLVDKDGKELVGDVAEVMTTLEDRSVIQAAEWEKAPLFLQVNAKERRGEYFDAKILRARKFDPATDGTWR
jgi:hypothetical protein